MAEQLFERLLFSLNPIFLNSFPLLSVAEEKVSSGLRMS